MSQSIQFQHTINSVATTTAIANSPLDKHLIVQEFPTLFVTQFRKTSLNVTLKYAELHNLLWHKQKGYKILKYFTLFSGN